MIKRRHGIALILLLLSAVSLACNLSVSSPGSAADASSAAGESSVADATPSSDASSTTSEDAGSAAASSEAPSQPVPFNQGLASLNSYRATISMQTTGPTALDKSIMETEMQYTADANARYTRTRTVSSSQEEPEEFEDVTEIYQAQGENCTFSGGEWQYTALSPIEQEVTDLFTSLVDFTPVVHNPVFVGEENLNGVMTNHFQFQLTGVGARSGALVTQSAGDYWLAQDGQYLVKYLLSVELRGGPETDPEAEVVQASFSAELQDINQPISISLPAECLALGDQQQ